MLLLPSLTLLKYFIFLHFHWSRFHLLMVFLVHQQPSPPRRRRCKGTEGKTSTISGTVTFLLVVAILLAFCLGVTANSCVHVCTSKVQTGLRWQKEAELKHVQMSCWSAHHSKLSLACSFLVNHWIILFFSFFSSVFWVFSSFDAEYRLSAPVLGTAPVNAAHPSPWHTGLILPSTGLCMHTSEDRVWVPKMLQSQSLKAKKCLAREKQTVSALSHQAMRTGSGFS